MVYFFSSDRVAQQYIIIIYCRTSIILFTGCSPRVLLLVFCIDRSGRAVRKLWPCPTYWSDILGSTCTCRTAVWTRTPGSGERSPGTRRDREDRIWICSWACWVLRKCDSFADSRWCHRWLFFCCRRTTCGCNT